MLTVMAHNPSATRMFFLEALGAGPRVRLRRTIAIAQFSAAIGPGLNHPRAEHDPTFPPIDTDITRAVVGACIEMILEHLTESDPETLTTIADRMSNFVRTITLATFPATHT